MSAIAHTFNDTVISQQSDDGYVHATAMCQANGKLFADYFRLKTTQEFLEALSTVMGIPITDLVRSIQGGDSKLQGTWVHPKVAIHLGQWCSPEFAVFVTELVFAWMTGSQPSTHNPQNADPFLHPEVQQFLETLIDSDLTQSEIRALCLLQFNNESLGYRELSERLNIQRSTAYSIVKRLKEKQLIEIQPRALRVSVTCDARSLMANAMRSDP